MSLAGPAIDHRKWSRQLYTTTTEESMDSPPVPESLHGVALGKCRSRGHLSDQPKAVVVMNISPRVFHRVSGTGAEVGTKVRTEFGTMHTGSFPCRCTVPSGWLDICLDSLAGDNGDGRPGGIGNMIQALDVLACFRVVLELWQGPTDTAIRDSNTTECNAVFPIVAYVVRSVYT